MVICLLAVLQSLMRFAIAGSILMGNIDAWDEALQTPISAEMMLALNIIFLLLGAFGIIFAAGLWTKKRWGLSGTIALSIATIIFDVWAILEFQPTAVMGLFLPVIFIAYLLWTKEEYLQEAS